ncbi:MAG: T9SS type A sorting domain-containing protein, partial [Ignavibacteria bacterium]
LIAGGIFTIAGGTSVHSIAKWNGSTWSPVGTGMNSFVGALTVYNNVLIAGGSFDTAGGVNLNRIAGWNGSYWASLGSGLDSSVYALTVYNNDIIAGGWFDTAGGIYAKRIARWNGNIGIRKLSEELPHEFLLSQNYPNPFNPSTKIKFDISPIPLSRGVDAEGGRGVSVRLTIYDLLGREVTTLVNQPLQPGTYEVEWDGTNYPSGVYFYRLTAGNYSDTKKLVLLK